MSVDYNNCDHLDYHEDFYYISAVALLWCGVPAENMKEELKLVSYNSESRVYVHPTIRCVETYSRIINSAINNNKLPAGRDGFGCSLDADNHVSPTRRTLSRGSLKKWIADEFPNNKPSFLFDEIERAAHPSITIEAFTVLKAKNEALEARLENATVAYKKQRDELQNVTQERDKLIKGSQTEKPLLETERRSLQNIIVALMNCIEGAMQGKEKHPSFKNRSDLFAEIDKHYKGYYGLSKSNLERKIPEAERDFKAQ